MNSVRRCLLILLLTALAAPVAGAQEIVGPMPLVPAGAISQKLSVYVTGESVSRSFFLPRVLDQVRRAAKPAPGASFNIAAERMAAPSQVSRGETVLVRVPVGFWGAGLEPVSAEVQVRVVNIVLRGYERSGRLYVSNNPESVAGPGTLLTGAVARYDSARFLYHHKNISRGSFQLLFRVRNPYDTPVLLHVVDGAPQVSSRETSAGHRAAANFMNNLRTELGSITEIPPRAELTLISERFDPQTIISGLLELRVLQGFGVNFSMKIRRGDAPGDGEEIAIGDSNGSRGHGEFPSPYLLLEDTFVVGGRWKFIGVGDQPLNGTSGAITPLAGNYGVTYDIRMQLQNPHNAPETVSLILSPVAGPVHALIFVDDRPVEVTYARPHQQVTLRTFNVPPGGTRTVSIETMPESGSFYPVRLVFGARRIE